MIVINGHSCLHTSMFIFPVVLSKNFFLGVCQSALSVVGVGDMTKSLSHDNNIYQDIVILFLLY